MIVISLSNKVAVVTGGANGIGRAISLQLAEAGCRGLTIVDVRDDEEARKVVSEVEELGSKALFLKADVSKDEDMKMVVEATGKKWGQLDIMVNNAGIAKLTDIFTTSVEQWDLVLGVNLRSVFIGMKHAAEYMKEHGGGCIVNMASIAGVTGGSTGPDYGASKAGVIALTKFGCKTLSQYGIRVNAIAPGYIETPMVKSSYEHDQELLQKRLANVPMGRMGTPEEVAKVALFLASNLATYINGETVMVTGGRAN
jgi:3-oxoacyl-[acyl-carrier protein] reductase